MTRTSTSVSGGLQQCLPHSDVSFEFGLARGLAANNIVLGIASIS